MKSYLPTIRFHGWELDIDFGCWFNCFHRGESGWWISIGPFLLTSPDFAEWHGN